MKSVVLLSGGLDSAVLLAWVKNRTGSTSVEAVTVDYGQRHRRELWSAFQIARYYGARDCIFRLPADLMMGSSLTGGADVPKGIGYADPLQASTVVPGRNLVLLSVAVAHAVKVGAEEVYFAAHAGDSAIYPDCRRAFLTPFGDASVTTYGVRIMNPFLELTKKEIVSLGRELYVQFDLTWSCYDPQGYDPLSMVATGRPCGECGACVERQEAMA